jgi:signal transduction histidine kinase
MSTPPPEGQGPGPDPRARASGVLRAVGAGPTSADPADASFAAARLTALAHDLANLLDGSMRCLGLAERSLAAAAAPNEELVRRLSTVHAAMRQMAELVRSAMDGVAADAGLGCRPGLLEGWTLGDAIGHAADVLRPIADESRVAVNVNVSPELAGEPAGPVYPVVAAAVRNSLESIRRRGGEGGMINVTAKRLNTADDPGGVAMIEVEDDGEGPPPLPERERWRLYSPGFSTKSPGRGYGLSVAHDVVSGLGGSIELLGREGGGAILRIMYPLRAVKSGGRPAA